jgi:predicted nucleic acid-binding protein
VRGFLLDTCAVSEFAKQSPNLGLVSWLARVDSAAVYLSAVTVGELRYGIARLAERKRRDALERWLQSEVLADFSERVLSFDGEVAERWGRLRADAQRAGTPVPVIDAMIAATAVHYNLALISRNEADFKAMPMDVINPWT